ncbi:C-terminal processing protease CtpA/Prc, contains a PDZ domain [Microbulbifer marinus]|uniref:C-terminal processing protease CtpA/Prc, contains a PDZ domain n=2 Tax=Microbulbifer marinus TaxID=658218 RepID=A0A1H3XHR2_9GAMM|nr:C-terminal processing protease CtpA/Prc, contains a PDZ domain [Microbulbifer marinus]
MGAYCRRLILAACLSLGAVALSACGGGGDGGDNSGNNLTSSGDSGSGTASDSWEPGNFLPASTFANQCVSPRSGTNPATGSAYVDRQGTRLDENNWLRSMSNDLYLWYGEIEDKNPAEFDDSIEYFDQLKTFELTVSGREKDRFHYAIPTSEWQSQTQSGVYVGYGFQWALIEATPPRKAVIAYTDNEDGAGLPPGIGRGAEVLAVDGVDVAYGEDVDTLNDGMWPSTEGETHIFEMLPLGASEPITVELTARAVTSDPVQNVSVLDAAMGRKVGYMLFNDHIATAEPALIEAVQQLKAEGIDDLVLDIRYNGGGYLDIASELAYMIAGDVTLGRVFEQMTFNDQHPETNPVTGEPLDPTPFHNETLGIGNVQPGVALPTLNLPRLFVLTGNNTCSASEAIINSLRGVDVEVVQIGATTCGKPYGFYALDNCGTTYLTIQFKGVNAKDFGDYADGFRPNGSYGTAADLPGCAIADDFTRLLGDENEARLSTAINYIESGSCGDVPASGYTYSQVGARLSAASGSVPKEPWRSNRIMVR